MLQEEIREYYWGTLVTNDLLELRNIATVADLIIVQGKHIDITNVTAALHIAAILFSFLLRSFNCRLHTFRSKHNNAFFIHLLRAMDLVSMKKDTLR